jgi:hypothetical protein
VVQAEAPAARERGLPAEDCRAQLHRILNSVDFEATDREHRFLSYVVEETLSGRGGRIKAYSIAVEVFGRDASFDPQSDPIVRIEAGHLRNDVGFDAPGADLLSEKPLQHAETDTASGMHVGMAFVDGVQVHHLAFRGKEVDWQLWVSDGEKPLPLKYVITSKWVAASPEYSIEFRNWNTAPSIDDSSFVFKPSKDARKLDALAADATGGIDLAKE